MNNLEEQCLEKLRKILFKFDLTINIVNIPSIECQYCLVDNSLTDYTFEWLCLWFSVSDILLHRNSIFECLESYHARITDNFLYIQSKTIKRYQRYSKAYHFIQSFKSDSLEEFLIKCDLMGI